MISELKVLESGAGFYIGTTYKEPIYDMELPYSRVSGYYPTHKDAETALNGKALLRERIRKGALPFLQIIRSKYVKL